VSIARSYDSLNIMDVHSTMYLRLPVERFSALLTKVDTAGETVFARYTERVFSVVGTIEMCFNQPSMIRQR